MSSIFDYPTLPIILVGKSLRVSNFNGVSLSTDRGCTQLLYNPDLPQVKILKNWLSRNSNHSSARLLSMRPSIGGVDRVYKTFAEIKQETEICEKEESYFISGCIGFIRKDDPSNLFYVACKNSSKCKKKVIQDSNG